MTETKNKEDVRTIRTKRDLANALEELLKLKDYAEISIKDISDTALISKNTFYNNFQDKEDLLRFVFVRYEEALLESIRPQLEKKFLFSNLITFKNCIEIIVHDLFVCDIPFMEILKKDSSRTLYYELSRFFQDLLKRIEDKYHILTKKASEETMIMFYAGAFASIFYFTLLDGKQHEEKKIVKDVLRLAFPAID